MRTFVLKLCAASVPFAVMVAVNVAVDPAGIARGGPEPAMAEHLLAGRSVAGVLDYDERLLQKLVIGGLPASPEVAVIGSSRGMGIRAEAFPGRTFYNAAVSAAVVDDLVALGGQLAEAGRLPRSLLLVIDPWQFNVNAVHTAWTVMRPAHDRVLQDVVASPESADPRRQQLRKYRELLSPAYFQASLRAIKAAGGRPRVRPEADESSGYIAPDGSHVYPLVFRTRPLDEVRQAAIRYATASDPYLDTFAELGEEPAAKLRALVRFLQAHGTTVTWLLVPFHPRAYDLFARSPTHRLMIEAEPLARDIARELGVPVLGSFDPGRCGCGESEFLDGVHPRESCLERILSGF